MKFDQQRLGSENRVFAGSGISKTNTENAWVQKKLPWFDLCAKLPTKLQGLTEPDTWRNSSVNAVSLE